MQVSKNKKILFNVSITIIVIVTCLCISIFIGLWSVSGLISADPYFYLAAGNTITGEIENKERNGGKFYITVNSEQFNIISVECTAEQFNELQIGTVVKIESKLCIE